MDKILEFGETFAGTGEPTVVLVGRAEGGRWYPQSRPGKYASEAFDYVNAVKPRDGCTVVLVNALGAYERYDQNRNGDGFPNDPYRVGQPAKCGHRECQPESLKGWIAEAETLKHHFKSFEQGGIYKHHCFPGETRVTLADGTPCPIRDIAVGDLVATLVGPRAVTEVMRRRYTGPGVDLSLTSGETLVATTGHPIAVADMEEPNGVSWSPIEDLVVGAYLVALRNGWVYVEARQDVVLDEDVYNLEVEDVHHYVANGVVVHNCNKDASKSLGKVERAFWNAAMYRVELLLEIQNNRDEELVARIGNGDALAVSMGCVLAGTHITLHDGRRAKVEDVKVGDRVRTHTGGVGPVTELHRRTYQGVLHTIEPRRGRAVTTTHEHPFFVATRDDVQRRATTKTGYAWRDNGRVRGEWVLAEELVAGYHFLLTPIDRTVETPDYATHDFARLLGYYVAEGNLLYDLKHQPSAVQFTANRADKLCVELPLLCHRLHTGTLVRRDIAHCDEAVCFTVYDRHLAARVAALVPGTAKFKRLDESVLRWHPALQRALFGAYAEGDGHSSGSAGKLGSLQISTASLDLAHQWIEMLPRFGVVPRLNELHHKAGSGFSVTPTTEYVVYLGKQDAQGLRDVCGKIPAAPIKGRTRHRLIIDDYVVTPIERVTRTPTEVPVFNFEVAGDESYVAGGYAVHNCHVRWDVCARCGHRAPTRKQYCEHVQPGRMGQIDPATGELACVLNPSPAFFDISFVFRPADRTGFLLRKVAHPYEISLRESSAARGEKVAAALAKCARVRKLSDIQKAVTGPVTAVRTDPATAMAAQYRAALVPATPRPSAPDADLASLAEHPVHEVLATLAAKQAALSTSEFARLLLLKTAGVYPDARLLDRLVAATPLVYETLATYPKLADALAGYVAVDARHVNPTITAKLAGMGDWLRHQLYTGGDAALAGPAYGYAAREAPRTDLLSMTDPSSGQVYQTTRGAALNAHHADMSALVGSTAGLSAVYGLGLHAAGAAAGLHDPGYRNPHYVTDGGTRVSGATEFKAAALLDKLAHDYAERTGTTRADNAATLRGRAGRTLGACLDDPRHLAEKFARLAVPGDDPTEPPDLPLGTFGAVLGDLLLER